MWLNQPSLTLRVLNLLKNVASHYFYYFQFTNFPPTTIESLFLEVTDYNNKNNNGGNYNKKKKKKTTENLSLH